MTPTEKESFFTAGELANLFGISKSPFSAATTAICNSSLSADKSSIVVCKSVIANSNSNNLSSLEHPVKYNDKTNIINNDIDIIGTFIGKTRTLELCDFRLHACTLGRKLRWINLSKSLAAQGFLTYCAK